MLKGLFVIYNQLFVCVCFFVCFFFCNMNSHYCKWCPCCPLKSTDCWRWEACFDITVWRCHWFRRFQIYFGFVQRANSLLSKTWLKGLSESKRTATFSIVYIAFTGKLQWFELTLYYLLMTNLLLLVIYCLLLSIVYYNGPNVFNEIYGWYLIKCVEALKSLSPNGYLIQCLLYKFHDTCPDRKSECMLLITRFLHVYLFLT